jgi:predicted component of type VI protein secretion system
VRIGRSPANDVALDWDREVSRDHARLEHDGTGWALVDDGSRNGSFVDGERVLGRRRLQDAQIIRLGRTVLLYRTSGVPATRPAPALGATVDAPHEATAQLTAHERELLTALAAGRRPAGVEVLWRRFDVGDLPEPARAAVVLRLARALGVFEA